MAVAWKTVDVGRTPFKAPSSWEFLKRVAGGRPTIVSFRDTETEKTFTVRKVDHAVDDLVEARRVLREVKMLRALRHDSVLSITDLFPPEDPDMQDLFIAQARMDTNFHWILRSKQILTDEHHQWFSYQMLRGLLYLHSANVIHCDLKPCHILVNKNCDIKITGFHAARCVDAEQIDDQQVVMNCWYRAPEAILRPDCLTKALDIWAAGCILGELIGRRPVFIGSDQVDQLRKIMEIVGTPMEADLDWLPEDGPPRRMMQRLRTCAKKPWSEVFPNATHSGVEAIESMLTFNPEQRASAQEALLLPYYAQLHLPEDEPTAEEPLDWKFELVAPTKRSLQNALYLECASCHPFILDRDAELLAQRGIDVQLLAAHGIDWSGGGRGGVGD